MTSCLVSCPVLYCFFDFFAVSDILTALVDIHMRFNLLLYRASAALSVGSYVAKSHT